MCEGAVAVLKCFSCIVYDLKEGSGHYCQACFTSRHPPHRVPHIFIGSSYPLNNSWLLR